MKAITVSNLTKNYGDVQALDNVSFSVPETTVYGFLGPNGAGKTTTIKVILQLITTYQGEVTIFGQRITPDSSLELRRQIGYLPQEPVFPAKFTGLEVMQFVGKTHGLDSRVVEQRTEELLKRFSLAEDRNRMVDDYSKGMKQRLGLAATMLPEPRLLILDEPTSALDPGGRREVLDIIRVQKGITTVFFSSHILADVEQICDRVTVLQQGKKIIEDRVQDLLEAYAPARYELIIGQSGDINVEKLLRTVDELTNLRIKNTVITFGFPRESMDPVLSQVLRVLLDNGIAIRQLAPARTNLEEVFFMLLAQSRGT